MNCTEVTPSCPVEATIYGYRPNTAANSIFLIGFAILFLGQIISICCLRVRTWGYIIALAFGTGLEIIGYVGRLALNRNPWSSNGFSTQLVGLIVGPAFIAAAVSVTFKQIVIYCGAEYSPIRPRLLPVVMVGTDFLCIFVQFVGASILAKATNDDNADDKSVDLGNAILIAGVAVQVLVMVVCGGLMGIFMRRVKHARRTASNHVQIELSHLSRYEQDRHTDRVASIHFSRFCWAMAVAFVTILIRCIYRLIEMASGWASPIMRDEISFLILEGGMILLALIILVVFQPGFHFKPMLRKG